MKIEIEIRKIQDASGWAHVWVNGEHVGEAQNWTQAMRLVIAEALPLWGEVETVVPFRAEQERAAAIIAASIDGD